jgi:hypothetical protein
MTLFQLQRGILFNEVEGSSGVAIMPFKVSIWRRGKMKIYLIQDRQ